MIVKAVQQIMLGTVTRTETEALQTLQKIKFCGYDGIELNGFMIRKTGLFVRLLTKAAGMPCGKGGAYDWPELVKAADLSVVSLHEDLGTIKKDTDGVIGRAKALSTRNVVITGMYNFDYTDPETLSGLCQDLNRYGEELSRSGIRLLYHNHNVELSRVQSSAKAPGGGTAYDFLLAHTDPSYVNFEFDSYWFTEAGANAAKWMEKLGSRMKLWHINDRGRRQSGKAITPILTSDSMELGYGNMDLDTLSEAAKKNGIEAVILESHRNHVDGDPIKSLGLSAAYLNRMFG